MSDPRQNSEWAVALDGGTTNTRARLVCDGRVVATARRPWGVRDTVLSTGGLRLADAVRECIEEVRRAASPDRPLRIVAAGMLSSEMGLCHVPHLEAPAGLAELARGVVLANLPEVADEPIAFVPGVRTPPGPGVEGWTVVDVMRGEECSTLGAWLALGRPGASVFLWPGSHTKLIQVDADGRIVRSHSTLAGELTAAVAGHTLLAASLPDDLPENLDPDAVAAGVRLAQRQGLGRAAFAVRLADLSHALDPQQRAAFWISAVAAVDVADLANHPILNDKAPVWVGGSQPRRGLYASLLARRHLGHVATLEDDLAEQAAALGAVAIVGGSKSPAPGAGVGRKK
ncbi:MAG: 2-dehydro-3-deoxygalactonokinase [Isosphaeraceae bacterium]